MLTRPSLLALAACLGTTVIATAAPPAVRDEGGRTVLEGSAYRVTFVRESMDMMLDLKGADGQWHPIAASPAAISFGYLDRSDGYTANGLRATWATSRIGEAVAIGRQVVLNPIDGLALDVHCLCTDAGMLMGARLTRRAPGDLDGALWCPPRILLNPADWDAYAFWAPDGQRHAGKIADLRPLPAYAGVSPWGPQGDTVQQLDARCPALIVRSAAWGVGLGVVFVDYASDWARSQMFVQQHTPQALYLYAGYSPSPGDAVRWAWLAPFPTDDPAAQAALAEDLVRQGDALRQSFRPISIGVPEDWVRPVPDFPASLRRGEPVRDINDAAVYSINESTTSDHGVSLARKVGSDVLIRGWFKWAQAPPVQDWRDIPTRAHQIGALFGGGITCSALYEGENGLTQEQVLDMATRGPAGQLIDAWDTPGIRHGSLSSPAYIDYLFRWCREQIDAGVDYLFMDEHTAAIGGLEGYDDHSLADFRRYLLEACPQTQGWAPDDSRWTTEFRIDLADPRICPTGKMDSFDYLAYMRAFGLLDNPAVEANPLYTLWAQFRSYRDDRAWKTLTERIRAYARDHDRTVLISANGIARYVDLQVLGVWGQWLTEDGHISLAENQLPYWHSLVLQGHDLAGKKVPVVLFHDWGFGDPPFPWLAVPPSEREVWMRTRGAEIYAAAAFFAFPVLGPFGCDAARDGTLHVIAQQTAFYQAHRDLYLRARFLGCESPRTDADRVSLAVWWAEGPRAVVLHAINRDLQAGRLQPRRNITVHLSIADLPQKVTVISPDWEGERSAECRPDGDGIAVTLPDLDAYIVALLHYAAPIDLTRLADPVRVRPTPRWVRPMRSEFVVRPDGSVEHAGELEGFLQGMLHTHLRNPPTFLVNATGEAQLLVHIRAVATAGARLEYRVDGEAKQTVDLRDLDGKNDGSAAEYDRTFTFPIPAGRHRVTLDNTGGDWAVVSWYQFQGPFAP